MLRTASFAAISLLVLLFAAAAPVGAQHAPPRHSTGRLVAGGLLGGVAGVAVGSLAGAFIGANSCLDEANPDSCRPAEGFAIGALSGGSAGIPLGVHLANGRAGYLAPSLLASAAIAVAGGITFARADNNAVMVGAVVAVPVLQIASSVAIERATARRRQR
jgi:hypothetical protein